MSHPGDDNLTYIIYNTLALLCKQTQITNATFTIARGVYLVSKIFDDHVLYIHGDHTKALTRVAMEAEMMKRAAQTKTVLSFMRFGHYHEYTVFGRGKIIGNGSLPGQDGYSDTKGFDSEAVLVINSYVKNDSRPTSFYRTFPVYLGDIK